MGTTSVSSNADRPITHYMGDSCPGGHEPSIGDTRIYMDHELMWDGGQWKHSPDCHENTDGIEE